ncbi:aspartate dehydrogenase [Paenarthrobacter nicotinovorans]|uniref:aspartate dehydrogenase domain-containing protein n=1 Tax=Micrococcaceae TaxID=1268 RepID=UPI0008761669|nr:MULTISPECIES: aspartate dehydrogenase domain-containing protein [Micrococcaceae]MDR6437399.1 aspartate dehydrogenase [Paenarthrobacter nicotinovorans]SCZ53409.1 aspartate dehydrogenase [Arthrobacter sp. UNCCL28]
MALGVALIGSGAIGSRIAELLDAGTAPGVSLTGVVPHGDAGTGFSFADALESADVVVECAGVAAVAEFGPRAIRAGKDLLVTSIGALCEPVLRTTLLEGGPGRTFLTTGALGGLDAITAARAGGTIHRITLESRKLPAALVQPWMDGGTKERLLGTTGPLELLRGGPAELIKAFPKSTNVVSALALAAGSWDVVEAVLIADPAAHRTAHHVVAETSLGTFDICVTNEASPGNPASSALVPHAVVRGLKSLANASGTFI